MHLSQGWFTYERGWLENCSSLSKGYLVLLSSSQNLRQMIMFKLTLLQTVFQQSQEWLPQRDLGKVTTKGSLLTASLNSQRRLQSRH